MLNFLELFFPGKSRLERELSEIEKELEPLTIDLIHWEFKELELMSLIQSNRKTKGRFNKSVEGNLCSIYHEHMAAYMWRKLSGVGDIELLMIKTAKFRFEYVNKGGRISMYIDKKFLGELKKDNVIYTSRKRAIAKIDVSSSEWWDIYLTDKKLGSLVNIDRAREVNPRAFFMGAELAEEEEAIFLSIAFYKIIEKTKHLKKIPFR